MATELATAYISLLPSTDKIAPEIKKQLGQVDGHAERTGRSMGSRLSGAFGKALKTGALAVSAGAVAVAGTALVKGFGRLKAIDEAEAKLRGLGHSATDISGIMDDVTAAVTGTAFGLDEAATASASALASGIKPGKELTEYLQLIGDAATQGGASFGEMAAIINKTTATGKVGMENLNQLSERGIGIMSWLADEYGVTGAELAKMVSKGEVDLDTFQKVLRDNIGGAALESGNTFSGAFANMNAALGRAGAKVLSGAFSQMPALFSGIGTQIDKVGPYAERLGEVMGGALASGVEWVRDAFAEINWGKVQGGFDKVAAIAKVVASQVKDDLLPALSGLWGMVKSNVQPVIDALVPVVKGLGEAVAVNVIPPLSTLIDALVWLEPVLIPIGAGILAIVAAMKIWSGVIGVITAVKKVWLGVQAALNAVMLMNPIGLVVLALVGLGAALVVAWKKSETFRNIVTGAWDAIKAVASAVADWFTESIPAAWETVKEKTGAAFDWISEKVSAVWEFLKELFFNWTGPGLIIKHWDTIKKTFGRASDWVRAKVAQAWERMKNIFFNWTGPGLIIKHWDTIKSTFLNGVDTVVGFVTGLPGTIKDLFADAKDWLLNAGRDIIDGLWNGLKGKWEDVKGWFGDATDLIPKLKGPEAKDRRLLYGAGKLVMGGFEDGLRDAVDGPFGLLTSLTDDIGALSHPAATVVAPAPVSPGAAQVVLTRADIEAIAEAVYQGAFNGTARHETNRNRDIRTATRIGR